MDYAKKRSAAGRIAIIMTAILWGLAGVCVKSITWSSMSQIAVRSVVSFLMLGAANRRFSLRFTKNNVIAAIAMALTGMLYLCAIKYTTAGTAIVLQCTAPIFVCVYAMFFQKRRAKLAEILIVLAVFGGIILSFADSIDPTKLFGNILGLASGITYAAQIIFMNREDVDAAGSSMMGNLMCILIGTPFLFFDKGLSFDARNLIWLGVLCFFQYGLANVCFSYGIKRTEKVEASLLLTIEPIFGPIPVAIFCHERMGTLGIIGSAIVIASVALYSALPAIEEKIKNKKEPPPLQ